MRIGSLNMCLLENYLSGHGLPRDAAGAGFIAITSSESHVWFTDLRLTAALCQRLSFLLSEGELARARRVHRENLRQYFIASHVLLRMILSKYAKRQPWELVFEYGGNHKPYLVMARDESQICFNLSKSGDWCAIAVTKGRELGVDIEQIREDSDPKSLSTRFFMPAEAIFIQNLPTAQKLGAFFALWTRKEACVKAAGHGLCSPLDQFTVLPLPKLAPLLVPLALRQFRLMQLPAPSGYAAALATEADGTSAPLLSLRVLVSVPPVHLQSAAGKHQYAAVNYKEVTSL